MIDAIIQFFSLTIKIYLETKLNNAPKFGSRKFIRIHFTHSLANYTHELVKSLIHLETKFEIEVLILINLQN